MNKLTKTAVVTFLAVFAVVLAGSLVAGLAVDGDETAESGGQDYVDIENPQYSTDRVVADGTPGQADIEMDSAVLEKKVVVEVGGSLTERAVQPLVAALVEEGHEVKVFSRGGVGRPTPPIGFDASTTQQVGGPSPPGGNSELESLLEDADGLISVGVSGYSEGDIEAIGKFVDDGGRVVMAVEPSQEFGTSTGLQSVFSKLGLYTEPGYVYNLEENDLNHQRIFAEPDGDTMLTDGVDRAVFDTATPVGGASEDETMVPIAGSELSTTRAETDTPVLIRSGDTAIVGDTGFMMPENTQRADNDVLVGNIADFLVTGNVDSSDGDTGGDDPGGDGGHRGAELVQVAPGGEPVFEPPVLEIDEGTLVRFQFETGGHNIVPTMQPEGADWQGVEELQDEGSVHEHVFEVEGVYEFVSEPAEEEGMSGAIIVGNPDPEEVQSGEGSGEDSTDG